MLQGIDFDGLEAHCCCKVCGQIVYRDDFSGISYVVVDEGKVGAGLAYSVELGEEYAEFGEVSVDHSEYAFVVDFAVVVSFGKRCVDLFKCLVLVDDAESVKTFLTGAQVAEYDGYDAPGKKEEPAP